MKGVIVYKGKYGATQQYANWIGEALQYQVSTAQAFPVAAISSHDVVIIGGSVYAGVWQMRDWLLKNAFRLTGKKVLLFIVCATKASEKDALLKIAKQNIPADLLQQWPLFFLHGRVEIEKLSRIDKWILKLGAWLTKDPEKRKEMLTDFNDVQKEHLADLWETVRRLEAQEAGAKLAPLK